MDTLKNAINHNFHSCTLDGEYSLLEWDFFDTMNKHFSEINQEYLTSIDINKESLFEKYAFNYKDKNFEIAFKALKNNSRTIEERRNWHNITLDYMSNFSINCSYLSPKAFLFYLPQSMCLVLKNIENDIFFEYFLFRLERASPLDIAFLNTEKIQTLLDFLS